MKFLAFAHVTICALSSRVLERLPTPVTQYLNVPNAPSKLPLMFRPRPNHDIYLFDDKVPMEITVYDGSFPQVATKNTTAHELFNTFSDGDVYSPDFNIQDLSRLSSFTGQSIKISGLLELPRLGFKPKIRLIHDPDGARFQDYVDSQGLVALAFYVDSLRDMESGTPAKSQQFDTCSPVFSLNLGSQAFDICFVTIGKIRIELLARTNTTV